MKSRVLDESLTMFNQSSVWRIIIYCIKLNVQESHTSKLWPLIYVKDLWPLVVCWRQLHWCYLGIWPNGNSFSSTANNTSSLIHHCCISMRDQDSQCLKWVPLPQKWSLEASTILISPVASTISSNTIFWKNYTVFTLTVICLAADFNLASDISLSWNQFALFCMDQSLSLSFEDQGYHQSVGLWSTKYFAP